MKNYIKLQTFERVHQAEIRKEMLIANRIEAVVINERDSLFLIGDIELYVPKNDKQKAKALINEFDGLTQINSFILEKPVKRFHDFLENKGIKTILKRTEDDNFVLDNYVLFIENENVEKVVPYLTGEELFNWKKIDTCTSTRQTRFRVEILEKENIDTIVIKKKDSEYHVEEINLFVENNNFETAKKILTEFSGWVKIKTYDKLHRAEIREDLLGKNKVKAIITINTEQEFDILVKENKKQKAIDIIDKKKNWLKVKSFSNYHKAIFAKDELENNNIDASIISRKDSAFLLGEYDLYVDDFMVEKAKKIVN